MLPSDIWNGIGALLIATMLLATHPIRATTAEHLTDQIAFSWNEMMQEDGCTRSPDACMMLPIAMPVTKP